LVGESEGDGVTHQHIEIDAPIGNLVALFDHVLRSGAHHPLVDARRIGEQLGDVGLGIDPKIGEAAGALHVRDRPQEPADEHTFDDAGHLAGQADGLDRSHEREVQAGGRGQRPINPA
jgi:hypothetical protein